MRIGYPGFMKNAMTAGMMQGMNQSGDRAMRYEQAEKQRRSDEARHAAEMALKRMEMEQQGDLASRRLDLDALTSGRNYDIEGRRTNIMGQEADTRDRAREDENTRAAARNTLERDLTRDKLDFERTEGAANRTHAEGMVGLQGAQNRQTQAALLALQEAAARSARGVGGWERNADEMQKSADLMRQLILMGKQQDFTAGQAAKDRDIQTMLQAMRGGDATLDRMSRERMVRGEIGAKGLTPASQPEIDAFRATPEGKSMTDEEIRWQLLVRKLNMLGL